MNLLLKSIIISLGGRSPNKDKKPPITKDYENFAVSLSSTPPATGVVKLLFALSADVLCATISHSLGSELFIYILNESILFTINV